MNREEFEALIVQTERDIYGFCRHLTMNRSIADDLYQETMLKAFEIRDRIEVNQNPKSFIISITLGIWKNQNRKEARRGCILPIDASEETQEVPYDGLTPEDEAVKSEEARLISEAVAKLDEKQRIVMILYYYNDCPIEEIARVLRIPRGTVKSRLSRGREFVKSELEKARYE